jgi:hypothetical protein
MSRLQFGRFVLSAVLAAIVLLGSGCDNTIDPFSGSSPFSIYGYLDLSEQRQFIRVKDMNQPLLRDSTRTIDATVTLENLDNGRSYTMQDSVIAFGDVYTHNFWADLTVEPGTEYRVTVTRSDGVTSQSSTRTPRAIAPRPSPRAGHCLTTFTITLTGIRNAQRVREVAVGFLPESASGPSSPPAPGDDQDPGDAPQQERIWVAADNSKSVSIANFGGDRDVQLRFTPEPVLGTEIPSINRPPPGIYYPRCWKLADDRILVAYLQLGPDWFDVPGGDVRFDPSESKFVENGLGFFGALRRDTVSVRVDTSDVIMTSPGISRSQRTERR